MMKIVKKAAMLAVAVIATATVSAQSLPMSVGGGIVYGTGDSYDNYGIQAKYRIGIVGDLRAEAGFTYFLKKDGASMWDASINAQYAFQVADKFAIYPLAGVSMMGISDDWDDEDDLGFNVGAGVDYDLTESLGLNAEFKYRLGDKFNDRSIVSLGVFYKF